MWSREGAVQTGAGHARLVYIYVGTLYIMNIKIDIFISIFYENTNYYYVCTMTIDCVYLF